MTHAAAKIMVKDSRGKQDDVSLNSYGYLHGHSYKSMLLPLSLFSDNRAQPPVSANCTVEFGALCHYPALTVSDRLAIVH